MQVRMNLVRSSNVSRLSDLIPQQLVFSNYSGIIFAPYITNIISTGVVNGVPKVGVLKPSLITGLPHYNFIRNMTRGNNGTDLQGNECFTIKRFTKEYRFKLTEHTLTQHSHQSGEFIHNYSHKIQLVQFQQALRMLTKYHHQTNQNGITLSILKTNNVKSSQTVS